MKKHQIETGYNKREYHTNRMKPQFGAHVDFIAAIDDPLLIQLECDTDLFPAASPDLCPNRFLRRTSRCSEGKDCWEEGVVVDPWPLSLIPLKSEETNHMGLS